MSSHKIRRSATVLALMSVALMASCGGGGDEEGAPQPLRVVPSDVTLTGPDKDTCGGGFAGEMFVYGGTAPYKIDNTLPGYMQASKTQVDHPGQSFTVDVLTGACIDKGTIAITDARNRQVLLTVSSKKGE